MEFLRLVEVEANAKNILPNTAGVNVTRKWTCPLSEIWSLKQVSYQMPYGHLNARTAFLRAEEDIC